MTKNDLRIVFLGTPEFAVTSLRAILDAGYNVAAVVTTPDKPAGRGCRMHCSAVKEFAVERGLPVLQPVKLKDPEFVEQLRALNADLFVVIAFRMLPEVVWTMPRLGTFNLHASLLPRYRGAAPINRAVMNGDRETGVTTFFLKHEIDTGDIIARERIAIGPDDNVGLVHDRLMELGARLTVDTIGHIVAGDLRPIPQDEVDDGTEACPAPKIFKETCRIDWTRSADEVHNHVRGLSPYPTAWTAIADEDGKELQVKIFATRRTEWPGSDADTPGTMAVMPHGITVRCGRGAVEVLELQPAGKKRMTADEFVRGARIRAPRMV